MLFISDLHQIRATLYPSSRSSMCTICLLSLKKKKIQKKNDLWFTMGKNIKSYATTQVHSPGKGREALQSPKSPNLSFKIWLLFASKFQKAKVQIFRLKYGMA